MRRMRIGTIALAAISLFAACSSEDTETRNEQKEKLPIAFSNYTGRSVTRGSIIDNEAIKTQGVGVFAMLTQGDKYGSEGFANFTPNFMNNIKVTRTGTTSSDDTWGYTPLRYWPNSPTDYVSFLAYSPAQETAPTLYSKGTDGAWSSTSGDLTWIKHEVNADPAKQIDLLRGRLETANMQYYYNTDGNLVRTPSSGTVWNGGPNDYQVQLDMIHALSRVAVVVTAPGLANKSNFVYTPGQTGTVEGNATITVNKIALLGDNASGDGTTMKGAFTPSAYLNLSGRIRGNANGNGYEPDFWSDKATEGKLAFSFDKFADGTYNADRSKDPYGLLQWMPSTTEDNVIKATMTDGNPDNVAVNTVGTRNSDYLFVIPQDFTSNDNPLYCYIEYTVKYNDGTTGNVKDNGVTYKAYGKVEKNMIAGGAYVIYIQIGNTGTTSLVPIEFHVYLEAWSRENTVNVNE